MSSILFFIAKTIVVVILHTTTQLAACSVRLGPFWTLCNRDFVVQQRKTMKYVITAREYFIFDGVDDDDALIITFSRNTDCTRQAREREMKKREIVNKTFVHFHMTQPHGIVPAIHRNSVQFCVYFYVRSEIAHFVNVYISHQSSVRFHFEFQCAYGQRTTCVCMCGNARVR